MYTTKNYKDEGGDKLVIGGVLEIRDDATVVGLAELRQYKWTAAEAVAESADGIAAAVPMFAEPSVALDGFAPLPCARNVTMKPGVSMGTSKKVVVHGFDVAGNSISEELTFNNASAVTGSKAFAKVLRLELPAGANTPVAQVETATAAGTVTKGGDALVEITSALFKAPVELDVPVELGDDAAAIAEAVREALTESTVIAEHFVVSGDGAAVVLTARVPAANDATLNIAISDGDSEGVSTVATSTNTTDGAAFDTLKLGWGKKLGLPRKLPNGVHHFVTYLGASPEQTAPTFATSGSAVSENTMTLNSTLNGSAVETLLIVR